MTTPRDDIAGLSEGLRIYANHSVPWYPRDLCLEAATQLDTLLKEREELTDRTEQLQRTLLSEQKLAYGLSVELRQFRDPATRACRRSAGAQGRSP